MAPYVPSVPTIEYDAAKLRALAIAVIETEAKAVADLASRIDDHFVTACHHMLMCQGRIVVTGMGKSGHVGSKIAATLASTGSPAFFVHPGEASHGDLGMITPKDTVLALSSSGETEEILTIVPLIKRLGVPLISLTGNPQSRLALNSTVHINVSVFQEACPLGLAPTSSTTAMLAMGDALAVALLEARGFTAADFARSHPAGRLGRRLLLLIDDIMRQGSDVPVVKAADTLTIGLLEMSKKGMGMTVVVGDNGDIQGIFTDGDLRRRLNEGVDIRSARMDEVMTPRCTTVSKGVLAAEVLALMQRKKINAVVVVDEQQRVTGALNMQDMLRAGVV